MTKSELQELSKEARKRALALADGDEEKAFTILGKGAQVPTGKAKVYNHAWKVRAVKAQLAYIEKLESEKEHEMLQELILELIEAMGDTDVYCQWVDSLPDEMSDIDFKKAIEEKLAEIEMESAQIIADHFKERQQDCIDFTDALLDELKGCNDNGIPGSCGCGQCNRVGEVDLEKEIIF